MEIYEGTKCIRVNARLEIISWRACGLYDSPYLIDGPNNSGISLKLGKQNLKKVPLFRLKGI